MKQFLLRYGIVIALLFSIGFLPVWLVMVIVGIVALVFENFFEVITVGIAYDIRFHMPGAPWYLAILHTGIIVAIYIASVVIHRFTRKPKLFL